MGWWITIGLLLASASLVVSQQPRLPNVTYTPTPWDGISQQLIGFPPLGKIPINPLWTALVNTTGIPIGPLASNVTGVGAEMWQGTTDHTYCSDKNTFGITFDDGPGMYTTNLLNFLKSINLKVTFFTIGVQIVQYPAVFKSIFDAGHQIGCHTWTHPWLTSLTNEQIIMETFWCEQAFQAVLGIRPVYMRPPHGDINPRVRSILIQMGYTIVEWTKDTNDWRMSYDTTFQGSWVTGNVSQWIQQQKAGTLLPNGGGPILLEHDLWSQSAALGPSVINLVRNAGFNIQRIGDCLGDPPANWYRNATVMPGFATLPTPSPTQSPIPSLQPTAEVVGTSVAPQSSSGLYSAPLIVLIACVIVGLIFVIQL
ncbi:hypothetical protein SmJEL517_g03614 [Synchytrium microbalum]|uniref:NodB homology domain-containing protein n=1 Tax=Synchytrium microbalum TaxID=1806994 RepID=A0A507C7G7_9FUNG|nr:uncharacterized protein SmJEL517_g03614 [Synchytrium microbalum]TPX33473.1 hypothetical protein SmJEL517_g03614 [Synchytrium microbalum]